MNPISIIVTTYESPAWLEKVLWGYAAQSYPEFEILVADDGSSPLTEGLIDQMRSQTSLNIRHVWHERSGFRKCRILNQAILVAQYPYLLFTDGDCIPRNDFVEVHARYARSRCFLSGGIVRLSRLLSHSVSQSEIMDGSLFRMRSLVSRGLPIDRKLRFLFRSKSIARIFERVSTTRATFNGYNTSAWKDDLLAVNGFDERMQYGGLDRELGERLVNAKIKPVSIRHRTVCLHLDHDRDYKRPELIAENHRIRNVTRQSESTWTQYGIYQSISNMQPETSPASDSCAEYSVY